MRREAWREPGDGPFGFARREWRMLSRLRTPHNIQRLLNSLAYHEADTAWSPRRVLHEGRAHCLEGALLAAAALRALGWPPLVVDMEAVRDVDHVVAVYRQGGRWGALAKSHFTGLRDRVPIYRTLRELVLSYFDDYFNLLGERTLRSYSRPLDLRRFDDRGWMASPKPVWYVAEHLCRVAHVRLIRPSDTRRLYRVDRLGVDAGLLGYRRPRIKV